MMRKIAIILVWIDVLVFSGIVLVGGSYIYFFSGWDFWYPWHGIQALIFLILGGCFFVGSKKTSLPLKIGAYIFTLVPILLSLFLIIPLFPRNSFTIILRGILLFLVFSSIIIASFFASFKDRTFREWTTKLINLAQKEDEKKEKKDV